MVKSPPKVKDKGLKRKEDVMKNTNKVIVPTNPLSGYWYFTKERTDAIKKDNPDTMVCVFLMVYAYDVWAYRVHFVQVQELFLETIPEIQERIVEILEADILEVLTVRKVRAHLLVSCNEDYVEKHKKTIKKFIKRTVVKLGQRGKGRL
jgi:hypothetical protein